IALFSLIPKGFFPQQDVGRLFAFVIADQDTSFQAMRRRLETFAALVSAEPAVQHSIAFAGGQNSGSVNQGRMFITPRPPGQRKDDVFGVMDRLRKRAARVPGASLYMQAMQDLSIGGRLSNAQFQYTLSSDSLDELNHWAPILLARLRHTKQVTDVSS